VEDVPGGVNILRDDPTLSLQRETFSKPSGWMWERIFSKAASTDIMVMTNPPKLI